MLVQLELHFAGILVSLSEEREGESGEKNKHLHNMWEEMWQECAFGSHSTLFPLLVKKQTIELLKNRWTELFSSPRVSLGMSGLLINVDSDCWHLTMDSEMLHWTD